MTLQSATRTVTHITAETQFVDVVCAYRRFGQPAERPLVMLQHVRDNLDNWDPALTDALGAEREVILIDYPGVGASRGQFGPSIADVARAGPPDARPASGAGRHRPQRRPGHSRLAG